MEDKHQLEETDKDKKLKEKEIFKFSFSSLISFIIDYSLYTIVIMISNNTILSNILARIISSIVNYVLNKRIVFKSKNSKVIEIIKYYSLAVVILIVNTLILKLLSNYIYPLIAKLLTELILFIISFIIQKKYIFKGSDKN